jgi:dinuclear metal center YbgI/SA1388 family protein
MKIAEILEPLEHYAPLAYQENYDNAGLITGDKSWNCTGILVSLDATEAVIDEAIAKKANLIISHHPIVFSGLKKINGKNYVEKAIIKAIKNDIALYAVHTNMDNIYNGVNAKICEVLGLENTKVLQPKQSLLVKLFTYVPKDSLEKVRKALFDAGAGHIGKYDHCSFGWEGTGTFRALPGADPYIGEVGKLSVEPEIKLEVILPAHIKNHVLKALNEAHPYEEVAYDVVYLDNDNEQVGNGMIGELQTEQDETTFLRLIKEEFNLTVIRHTPLTGKKVKKVAVCGGSGSRLIGNAAAAGADFYISSDIKYHEFFDANDRLVVADIGHWESEQFTTDLILEILRGKFPTFAVLKSGVKTNPVNYFT